MTSNLHICLRSQNRHAKIKSEEIILSMKAMKCMEHRSAAAPLSKEGKCKVSMSSMSRAPRSISSMLGVSHGKGDLSSDEFPHERLPTSGLPHLLAKVRSDSSRGSDLCYNYPRWLPLQALLRPAIVELRDAGSLSSHSPLFPA